MTASRSLSPRTVRKLCVWGSPCLLHYKPQGLVAALAKALG